MSKVIRVHNLNKGAKQKKAKEKNWLLKLKYNSTLTEKAIDDYTTSPQYILLYIQNNIK